MKRCLSILLCCLLCAMLCITASAETTPIQSCHQATLEKITSTTGTGASVQCWHITTCLEAVNEELNALADDYASQLSPALLKPGKERTENSVLYVRILRSRTGLSWMSFMVQARQVYHRQTQQVLFTTRTYDMETGEQIRLTDIFPADSPAWDLLADAVRETVQTYYPDKTADEEQLNALCTREAIEQADFTLHGMSLVLHLPSIYPDHPQLMEVTLYYPDIRQYMTETAQQQTDNASLYQFCALTFDDGPNQWSTPHVLDALMETGARATFFALGRNVKSFPYLVQQEHDEGHAVATHFYEHLYAMENSADVFLKMYDKVNSIHIQTIGIAPSYARAPGGQWQRMSSYQVGWPLIQWTAEARDWDGEDPGPDPTKTANTIVSCTKSGGIILMHDIKNNSAKATQQFIPRLEERGYMFLTVDELFASGGITLEPNQTYWRCLDGVTTDD